MCWMWKPNTRFLFLQTKTRLDSQMAHFPAPVTDTTHDMPFWLSNLACKRFDAKQEAVPNATAVWERIRIEASII